MRPALATDDGSAAAEFVMVGALLTVLTLSVLQLAFALHVRNTIIDAAAEGARYSSLAGNGLPDGVDRTEQLIAAAVGDGYAADVTARYSAHLGYDAVAVTVRTTLPLLGLAGLDGTLEVTGHAAREVVR